jgi:phosphate starvation-inducible protein PhoH and related proteins
MSRTRQGKKFHLELINTAQKVALSAFRQHDVLFLTGPAGVGKTYLAVAFAIEEILTRAKSKIILTRPVVEAGESLGYLPGEMHEKVDPYMRPFFDVLHKLLGKDSEQRKQIDEAIEIIPLAYMRGRSLSNAICILDEAQNASFMQLKLFLSRFEEGCKVVISGDPYQSDCFSNSTPLVDVMRRLETLQGVGMVRFKAENIVRHPLVGAILQRLEEEH